MSHCLLIFFQKPIWCIDPDWKFESIRSYSNERYDTMQQYSACNGGILLAKSDFHLEIVSEQVIRSQNVVHFITFNYYIKTWRNCFLSIESKDRCVRALFLFHSLFLPLSFFSLSLSLCLSLKQRIVFDIHNGFLSD